MARKRIYIAGAFDADNAFSVFDNMRKGMRLSTKVLLAGYSPFCPWLDYHFRLMLRGEEDFSVRDILDYGLAWVAVSDAVLVHPGWYNSEGTKGEIKKAESLKIPVFYDLSTLKWEIPV